MKNLIRQITFLIVISLTFSCNDDFIKDKLEHVSPENASIVISPDWVAQDYPIYCPDVGNAKFKVTNKPSWLKISSSSGQFVNGFATLNCKASVHDTFSEIGIYYSYMTLSVEGKGNQSFLVTYINEGNPVIEMESRVTIDYHLLGWIMVKNSGNGILLLSVLELPEWLSLTGKSGETVAIEEYPAIVLPPYGERFIPLKYNQTVFPFWEDLTGKIIILTNDRNKPLIEVEATSNFGDPLLEYYYYNNMDFGRTETIREISFSNRGSGFLVWKIEGCPQWLNISESDGVLSPWSQKTITFTCKRDLLPPGVNSTTIYLETNDKNKPSQSIPVIAENHIVNTENVKPIGGNITDVFFDNQSDILYLTTIQPNHFIVYDTKNRTIVRELPLNYAPNCFSLSEDGKKAIIGHNKYVSSIDMDKISVNKTIGIDYNIFDIEWGTDNWFCYTPGQEVTFHNLYWKNIDTEEIYETPYEAGGTLTGKTLVKKIPYQNYIVASRTQTSASGIIVFDIQTRYFVTYFNEDLFLPGAAGFWFSSDGSYLFSSAREIFRTSSFFVDLPYVYPTYISPIGNFYTGIYRVHWIDHNAASHSMWVLSSDINGQREIRQYEDNNFSHVNTYQYDDFYYGNPVQAHYVFANKAGTELIVIRNVTNGVSWSLEFIPVEE